MHRATLLESGKAVVVKVQYPEVRRLFDSDFSQIAAACCFWTPQVAIASIARVSISALPAASGRRRPVLVVVVGGVGGGRCYARHVT